VGTHYHLSALLAANHFFDDLLQTCGDNYVNSTCHLTIHSHMLPWRNSRTVAFKVLAHLPPKTTA
jgi:hypothetical protein